MARGTVLSERVRTTQGETPSPLVWLNLVCLDAPLVAVTWQAIFARALSVKITVSMRAALFFTAWAIYLLDRVGDSFNGRDGAPLSLRQRFARDHRAWFVVAVVVAAIADAVAVPQLDRETLIGGAALGAASAIYLAVNHFFSRFWRTMPVKEIAIGLLFAAGVRASFGEAGVPRFGPAAVIFAALCALNCISIAYWERDLDVAQGRSSIATAAPGFWPLPLIGCAVLTAVAFICMAVLPLRAPLICVAVSSALLALLNIRHFRVQPDARTALADLVLLTPLCALPFAT